MTPSPDAEDGACEICGEREAATTVADGNEVCADCATMFGSVRTDDASVGSNPQSDVVETTTQDAQSDADALPLGPNPDGIPDALRERPQWVCWRVECRACGHLLDYGAQVCADSDCDGDPSKVPVVAGGGYRASTTDPESWTDFETALAYHRRDDTGTEGIGYVFAENGPFVGIDLDNSRDPETGEREAWAADTIDRCASYAAVSSSATGDHTIARGKVPDGGNRSGDFEMYDRARYFALTGVHIDGTPVEPQPAQDAIDALHAEHVGDDASDADENQSAFADATPTATGDGSKTADLSDADLLERARNAENGALFDRLWSGNASGYKSHSEARQAFANLLAFWTGGDERRMLNLFRQSDLCRGDDDIRTFENYEIPTAIEGRAEDDFYDPGGAHPSQSAPTHLSYEVLDADGADVDLRLVPVNGTQIRVDVAQNDSVEYSERRDRGFWDSSHIRAEIANEVADRLTGVDSDLVGDGVRDALTRVSIDAEEDREGFADALRSQRERDLRARTVCVESYPAAGDGEWVVTMRPPDGSTVNEPQDLRFSAGDLLDGNAGSFRTAHITAFQTKVALDAAEWGGLTDYWLDVATVHERDPDHRRDAAVESFIEWVRTMPVWGDEEGFRWSGQNGFYYESFDGDSDAVLVPGRAVVHWKQRKDFGDINLSRALREEDVLLGASDFVTIRGDQYKAWPVDADVTPHNLDNVARTPDAEGDGEAATNTTDDGPPEGLRG